MGAFLLRGNILGRAGGAYGNIYWHELWSGQSSKTIRHVMIIGEVEHRDLAGSGNISEWNFEEVKGMHRNKVEVIWSPD